MENHIYLGNAWGERDRKRHLSLEDRSRHILITGGTGTGKSTLLSHLFKTEVDNGRAVILVDPHGELAEQCLGYVHSRRIRKTIYFNPSDVEHPVGFNVLYNVHKQHQARVAADIVSAFKSVWGDSWGPRLEHILTFTLQALMEMDDATLLCIPRMLLDAGYRDRVLRKITDAKVLQFWRDTFPLYLFDGVQAFTPILNKVDALLASPLVRNIIGQPKSAFDPRHLIDNKYVVIANFSKGLLGDQPANLLGSLFISSFASAAMSRADMQPEDRKPVCLIVDEFTNYTTDKFKSMLSEVRKYNLALVLSHQYLDQMTEEVRHAALGTVGSFIVFRVSGEDGKRFASVLPDYPHENYSSTGNYRAFCRLIQYGSTSNVFELHTPPPPKSHGVAQRQKIIRHSRIHFATHKDKVESRINRFLSAKPKNKQRPPRGFKRS